ncbi:hypothetical protein C943_03231 [Mariniradius saccharolyticus AK6]|uniref:Secretion system C-terminal sorting domain-containing protein n=2 Tax=Mariniradius TaxID=1245590 RepID=M7XJD1_9BACT|nr:hypothetical protein C943_03231 [Mariniradius saccharolyticus AK6]
MYILVFCMSLPAWAQQVFTFGEGVSISVDGEQVPMPFAVGINAAQFQQMDLDGDGTEEWIVWDINSRRVLVFSKNNESFNFRAGLAYSFPSDISGFLVLRDFDGDGKMDIFTSSPFGIKVYRNSSPSGASKPQWTLAQNFLRLDNGSNLQANNLDIPLVTDLDGDGDLDIVTFNFASGDYLEYYRNTSLERKGQADVDGFAFPESHWGGFEFCGCGAFSFGISCLGVPFARLDENKRVQHAGGHSILFEDFDGDGIRDLLLGRDECGSLYFLPNLGSNNDPVFESFSQELPGYGPLPQFPIFHTAFLDRAELIVSSNTSEISVIFQADFSQNIFVLPRFGTKSAVYSPFLQDQMLDLGESSRPFFKGVKEDGTLIVTANSKWNGKVVGLAYRLDIKGNDWVLAEMDYLGMSAWDLLELQYFEYVKGQGGREYWISGIDTVAGLLQRRVWVGENAIQDQMQELVFPGTGIRTLDHVEPFAYKGKDYLLLARQTGELVLFEVVRGESISLELLERNFLGLSDNPARRNLSVHVIQGPEPSLYLVDQNGELRLIRDFMGSAENFPVQLDLGQGEKVPTRLSRSTWISSIAAAFGNSHDLVLGNTAGGLEYLKSTGDNPSSRDFLTKVYPNPNQGEFFIVASKTSKARLINSLGQILMEDIEMIANRPVQIQYPFIAPGLYLIQIESVEGDRITRKIWVNQ